MHSHNDDIPPIDVITGYIPGPPPIPESFIITEDGDFLITEDGDFLITEI